MRFFMFDFRQIPDCGYKYAWNAQVLECSRRPFAHELQLLLTLKLLGPAAGVSGSLTVPVA